MRATPPLQQQQLVIKQQQDPGIQMADEYG
jgi:hypothetical protein